MSDENKTAVTEDLPVENADESVEETTDEAQTEKAEAADDAE